MNRLVIAVLFQVLLAPAGMANFTDRDDVQSFLMEMNSAHGFSQEQLNELFSQVKISGTVLKAISRPAEKLVWHKYRDIFIRKERIRAGIKFFKKHKNTLERAEKEFGVPAEIIVAIIGVETFYGKNKGRYRVLDSLATLAFDYPKRSKFFRSELEHYLLLTREQDIDPLTLKGSYAGAMGIPQFIASSYRNYAIDFDGDGRADIWNNPDDAIGSVANYFNQHDWLSGQAITAHATAMNDEYRNIASEVLKSGLPYSELVKAGIESKQKIASDEKVLLIELELPDRLELWIGLHNFYVITRYNHSVLYAMAIYQLSSRIKSEYQSLFH